MANRKADFIPMSRAGMGMLIVSAAEIALGLAYLVRPVAIGAPVKFAMLAALGGSVFLLFRFAMPGVLRILFAVLMIALMIFIAVRADVLGLNSVSQAVGNATEAKDMTGRSADEPAERGAASSGERDSATHAVVRLSAADSGDGGWAGRINAAATRDAAFAGLSDVTVRGFVALRSAPQDKQLQIIWTVETRGKGMPCGMLSLAADENPMAIVQLLDTFRLAAQRSSESAAPRCN